MSAIAAVLNLDGVPADRALAGRMIDAASHRGPDVRGVLASGPCALAGRGFAADVGPVPPVADESGAVLVTLDGRLDNREELREACARAGFAPQRDTDADLLLRAYLAWGDDTPGRLLGDYAFVIWDARRRHLLAARDTQGVRPLMYAAAGGMVVVASEMRQVLAAPAVSREPNLGFLAEYLAVRLTTRTETVYRAVHRLQPAHALTVDDGRVRVARYWDIDPGREVRYRDEREYDAHFRELFSDAVRRRLPSSGCAGILLSGGIDSSSVTVAAAHLMASAGSPIELRAYSQVFDSVPDANERSYIEDVVRVANIPWQCEEFSPTPLSACRRQVSETLDLPQYAFGTGWSAIKRRAAADGCRVMLSGIGGDEWYTGSMFHSTDLLRRGRVFAAAAQIARDGRLPDSGLTTWRVARTVVWPIIPPFARRVVNRFVNPSRTIPRALTERLVDEVDLMERVRVPHIDPRFPTAAAGGSYVDGTCGTLQFAGEIEERASSAAGLQVAYPFHDRRLVEFGMAIPERERWHGDLTKIIVRRALADLLPPSVRWRRTKTDPAPVIVMQLMTPEATATLGRLRLAEDGLIEQREVDAMVAEMIACYRRGEPGFDPLACRLWPILAAELVWTTLFAAGGTPRISGGESDDRFESEIEPTRAHT